MRILFFGTPQFARDTLDTLESKGFVPALVVTQEDKPSGRKMLLTPSPVKEWALARSIPTLQPKTLRDSEIKKELASFGPFDVAIVASYGKIIPQEILDLPHKGCLNIHPSLLPRHRGASPIQSTILEGDSFGVTIIKLDADMDHGPILAQKEITESILSPIAYRDEAEKVLAHEGTLLLSSILADIETADVTSTAQDHTQATFCKKIQKADGLVDLTVDDPEAVVRKVRAFVGWPSTFFMTPYNDSVIRVQITKAHLEDGKLVITHVKPEGKKEIAYEDFLRGNHSR